MTGFFEDMRKDLQEAIRKDLERSIAMMDRLTGPVRKGHYEPDEELMARFRDYEARYTAVHAEGVEAGFLLEGVWGEGDALEEPRGTWVWDETEEEFEARKKRESCDVGSGGHIVFPVARGPRP